MRQTFSVELLQKLGDLLAVLGDLELSLTVLRAKLADLGNKLSAVATAATQHRCRLIGVIDPAWACDFQFRAVLADQAQATTKRTSGGEAWNLQLPVGLGVFGDCCNQSGVIDPAALQQTTPVSSARRVSFSPQHRLIHRVEQH